MEKKKLICIAEEGESHKTSKEVFAVGLGTPLKRELPLFVNIPDITTFLITRTRTRSHKHTHTQGERITQRGVFVKESKNIQNWVMWTYCEISTAKVCTCCGFLLQLVTQLRGIQPQLWYLLIKHSTTSYLIYPCKYTTHRKGLFITVSFVMIMFCNHTSEPFFGLIP